MITLKCNFCGENHISRNCNIEKKTAPLIKEFIGYKMEYFVENNIKCPNCKKGNFVCTIGGCHFYYDHDGAST